MTNVIPFTSRRRHRNSGALRALTDFERYVAAWFVLSPTAKGDILRVAEALAELGAAQTHQ